MEIYSSEKFLKRTEKVKKQMEDMNTNITEKQDSIKKLHLVENQKKQFIPKVKNIITIYYTLTSAEEKNKLLKEVIEKITYSKDHTARFTKDYENFEIVVYPKISDNF